MSLIDNIKESEGFRSKVYKCTEGYDTIGYGFAIKDLEMDEEIAEKILEKKLESLIARVHKAFPWTARAPKEVEDVVVEMCYQMGVSGVSKFKKALGAMEWKNYSLAADELLDSRWARQTPNRAKKLSDIIRRQ
mgnify:CR=1 FL=1|tara:strand:+ start:97 stop:498 length:402 start_codon:yes stop_codon:yes gene_type:complete